MDNEAGIASGHADAPLSPVGERQAAELAVRYPDIREVWCSDLQRSYRTAEIAFGSRSDVIIHRDARLREVDFGAMTRSASQQIETNRGQYIATPYPDGESYLDVCRRVAAFLHDTPAAELLVGHRAIWYALEHLLKGRDLTQVVTAHWRWQPGWRYQGASRADTDRALFS